MAAAAFAVRFMLNMGKGDVYDIDNMLVIQRLEYVFPVTAAFYQPFVF